MCFGTQNCLFGFTSIVVEIAEKDLVFNDKSIKLLCVLLYSAILHTQDLGFACFHALFDFFDVGVLLLFFFPVNGFIFGV